MITIGNIPILDRDVIKETLINYKKPPVDKKDRFIAKRYQSMSGKRQPYLDEARTMSQAVIPYLFAPEGTEPVLQAGASNQALVAQGVINISKALSETICPPNARFFTHTVLPAVAKQIEELKAIASAQQNQGLSDTVQNQEAIINNQLIERGNKMRAAMKASPDAENLFYAMLFGVLSGIAVFCKPNKDTSKVYTLENTVCEFDSGGELIEVIVKDMVHISKFSEKMLKDLFGTSDYETFEGTKLEYIPVFTRQVRRADHWEIQVEIAGERYAPMEGIEDLEAPPFIVIPFFLFPGMDYPISWVTHNRGDIIEFENISLSLNELIKAACKVIGVLPPELLINQKELTETAGFSWIPGSPAAPQVITADIARNLQSVQSAYEMARNNIMTIFLLLQSIRRDAERVTQYELQQMVQALRDLLGGIYISIGRRFQRPYVNRMEALMEKDGELEPLPQGTYQLVLTAGLETLEAAEELQAIDQFISRVMQLPGNANKINIDEYNLRVANCLSVVADRLLLSDDEAQSQAGVQQIVAMAKQLGPQGPQMIAQMIQQFMMQMQKAAQNPQAATPDATQAPPTDGQDAATPEANVVNTY